jgi:hypothetical protein
MKRTAWILVVGLSLGALSIGALAQDASPAAPFRLLVVDETKTFLSTMRIGGLVGALKQLGVFEVRVQFADVSWSYDDPLDGAEPPSVEERYDVMVILPRGLDDGSIDQIWLLSETPEEAPEMWTAVEGLAFLVDQVFDGVASAVDVTEDLWPGLLWLAYSMGGWTR